MILKRNLKEICKKFKHIHGQNISKLTKKELLNLYNICIIKGGCNNPQSANCPKNKLINEIKNKLSQI